MQRVRKQTTKQPEYWIHCTIAQHMNQLHELNAVTYKIHLENFNKEIIAWHI